MTSVPKEMHLSVEKPKVDHGIIDNRRGRKVVDFLQQKMTNNSEVSVVSAYFTIYAFGAMREELEGLGQLRFLFGEPSFLSQVNPEVTASKAFEIGDAGISLANRLSQKELAKACAEWIKSKVEVRSVKEAGLLHGKLYHIDNGHRQQAIMGSSNFTSRGLGVSSTSNIELNMVVDSDRDRAELLGWFEDVWTDKVLVADVKSEVLRLLEQVYIDHDPEFIYFKTLFHVFESYLSGREADDALFCPQERGWNEWRSSCRLRQEAIPPLSRSQICPKVLTTDTGAEIS